MKLSIIILTKNGQDGIKKCLDKVTGQKFWDDFEVIVIDSGSTDKTLDILKDYRIKLHKIPPEDFSHSKTRNLGVSLATGEHIVFLTQDAEPVDENWLQCLISPLLVDASVGAVFGRQIPTPQTDPVNSFRVQWIYGKENLIKHKDSKLGYSRRNFNFSDANSAIRRDLLIRFPFREDLLFCEDVYMAKELMENGYKIAYSSKAAVWHSHRHSIAQVFSRYFDIAVAYRKIGILEDTKKIENEGREYMLEELNFLMGNGYWLWIPYAIVNNLSKYWGFKIGCLEPFLPLFLKKGISKYWYKVC